MKIGSLFLLCIAKATFALGSGDPPNAVTLTAGYSFHYDWKFQHHTAVINLSYGDHMLGAGPQYTGLLEPFHRNDPITELEKTTTGLFLNYRYRFGDQQAYLRPFGDLRFSIFNVRGIEKPRAPNSDMPVETLYVVNILTAGAEIRITDRLLTHIAVGGGSLDGFFLVIRRMVPSVGVGLAYRLN